MATQAQAISLDSDSAGRQEFQQTKFDNGKKKGGDESSNLTFLKITGILAGVAALTLVIVLPVYFTVIEPNNSNGDDSTTVSPKLPENERFDCLPGEVGTEEKCIARGCTWSATTSDAPSCYFTGSGSYSFDSTPLSDNRSLTSSLRLRYGDAGDHFGKQFETITVVTTYITDNIVRIKIYPDGVERYEVPIDHPAPETAGDFISAVYSVSHSKEGEKFGVKISRKNTSKILFDSSVGNLMFADQFLQISTTVASEYIYGFGEHMHRRFKHNMKWETYGMFTYDQNVALDYNLYGMQTYFMCMEGNGTAYGVFFVNSNAMEVTLQPTPAITYRTIGGIFDFYVFLGPSPEQVTQQYMQVIGTPYFPPYWSLGFQLCRWNYGSLAKLREVVNRTLESGIPYDVQYSDIDYMERQLDFTIDNDNYKGITDFVLDLKSTQKMRYIIILDPAISGNETSPYPAFDDGLERDIFIKFPNDEIAWGKVWPDKPNITVNDSADRQYQIEHFRAHTAYPDYFNPNTTIWWKQLIKDFRSQIEFDGLWIDMNEPTSFTNGTVSNTCPEHILNDPPFYPNLVADHIYDLTICMQTLQYHPKAEKQTEHYNLHSLYGWSEVQPTLDACRESTGERCLVLTRSTYPGAGKNAGHWLGDNVSNWEHLRASIIGMMEFSLFGFAYNGADVCGFFQDTSYELCLRWMQVGAFYPFYRNHNVEKTVDQDPAVFGQEFIGNITPAMNTRYELLPFLYTLFYEAHVTGSTVVRPLMHEFPKDLNTYVIETQFLWGPAILITAVLEESATSVTGYFPQARWFNYYNGEEVLEIGTGKEKNLSTALNEINVHIRGGQAIPTQEPAKNTYYSRQNPLGIVVALDEQFKANGQLFWDDGNSVDTIGSTNYTLISFDCAQSRLNITVECTPVEGLDPSDLHFAKVSIFGVEGKVTDVDVSAGSGTSSGTNRDNEAFSGSGDFEWTASESGVLLLTNLELSLTENHYITWQ